MSNRSKMLVVAAALHYASTAAQQEVRDPGPYDAAALGLAEDMLDAAVMVHAASLSALEDRLKRRFHDPEEEEG